MNDLPVIPDEDSVWNLSIYISDLSKRDPALEHYLLISNDAACLHYAITYALVFFKEAGWPELEQKIKDSPWQSYRYAVEVLSGRFPECEKVMANSPGWAFYYASNVIRGPFPPGEKAIARDPWYSWMYARDVLKARFPLGEPLIYCSYQAQQYRDFLERVDDE